MNPSAAEPITLDRVRSLVADRRCRVELDEVIAGITFATLAELQSDRFVAEPPTYDEATVQSRLDDYQAALPLALSAAVLIARWGERENVPTLQRLLRDIAEHAAENSGTVQWSVVRWTPLLTVLYAAGIAAILGDRPEMLAGLYTARRGRRNRSEEAAAVVCHAIDSARHAWGHAAGLLTPYRNRPEPFSEYMFNTLRATLDTLIHAGSAYDDAFDRFEILNALSYASAQANRHGFWGPPGRFALQFFRGGSIAFSELQLEAAAQGSGWAISSAGMFGGSHESFLDAAKRYQVECLKNLNWY